MTFEEFLTAELPGLTRFAAVLTGDRHLAEDVVQDALVKAHGKWSRIAAMDLPVPYVRRMIVNGYLSWRRRWSTRTITAAGDLHDHNPADGGDFVQSLAHADHVQQLLATLPPRQRAAIVLRYYAGFDDRAAAQAMSCSVQTVRSHISRGLSVLRRDPSMREFVRQEGAVL